MFQLYPAAWSTPSFHASRSHLGQNRKSSTGANVFRFAPESRHCSTQSACRLRAINGSREISSASPRASDEAIELRAFPDGAENWSHDILGVLQHYLPPAVISRARFVERVTRHRQSVTRFG